MLNSVKLLLCSDLQHELDREESHEDGIDGVLRPEPAVGLRPEAGHLDACVDEDEQHHQPTEVLPAVDEVETDRLRASLGKQISRRGAHADQSR